jgi:hypothetical protein
MCGLGVAVEVHDFGPGCHEVGDELRLGVVAGVDLGEGAQFGVGAEDQVGSATGPSDCAGGPVAALEGLFALVGGGPGGV